jgi:hypothetical protein
MLERDWITSRIAVEEQEWRLTPVFPVMSGGIGRWITV